MVLTYLGSIAITGQVYPLVDFNGQGTLPSLLQALHFFTIGLLILWLLAQPRSQFPYPSRPFLIAFALLMAYATLDELFKIHLHLKPILAGHDWKWFYLGGFVALMLGCQRDFKVLWQQYRREIGLVLVGMSIFILGGYGSEFLKGAVFYQRIAYNVMLGIYVENLRIVYEECSELIGENLILYACLQFIGKRSGKSAGINS